MRFNGFKGYLVLKYFIAYLLKYPRVGKKGSRSTSLLGAALVVPCLKRACFQVSL